jgi:protein SCO1
MIAGNPSGSGARSGSGLGARLQSGVAKLVGSRVFWILFTLTLFGLPFGRSLARSLPPAPPALGQVESFELEDQYGRAVSDTKLRGQMWVLAFTSASAQLRSAPASGGPPAGISFEDQRSIVYRTRNLGSAFRMITVTTTPDEDTREVRRVAVEKHSSSADLWAFLGGERFQVERAAAAVVGPLSSSQIDQQLFLIDRKGQIRGVYAPNKIGIDHLMQDLSYVANFP